MGPGPDLVCTNEPLAWRQGDCVVGTQDFVFRILAAKPLSRAGRQAVADDPDTEFVVELGDGLMVVTQSCDIVRNP
jgi:hypothetical protein